MYSFLVDNHIESLARKSKSSIILLLGKNADEKTYILDGLPLATQDSVDSLKFLNNLDSEKANGSRRFLCEAIEERLTFGIGGMMICGLLFKICEESSEDRKNIEKIILKYLNRLSEAIGNKQKFVCLYFMQQSSQIYGNLWDAQKRTSQSFESKPQDFWSKFYLVSTYVNVEVVLPPNFYEREWTSHKEIQSELLKENLINLSGREFIFDNKFLERGEETLDQIFKKNKEVSLTMYNELGRKSVPIHKVMLLQTKIIALVFSKEKIRDLFDTILGEIALDASLRIFLMIINKAAAFPKKFFFKVNEMNTDLQEWVLQEEGIMEAQKRLNKLFIDSSNLTINNLENQVEKPVKKPAELKLQPEQKLEIKKEIEEKKIIKSEEADCSKENSKNLQAFVLVIVIIVIIYGVIKYVI